MKPNRPRLAQRVASLSVLAVGAVLVGDLQAQAPPVATQIAAAVQAAPAGDREGAKVLGYQDDGSIVTLREGSNHLVCLADDPGQDGWSVACYHDSLDPFMARGRALRAQGVTDAADVTETRFAEAEAGTLAMPEKPAMLYVLTGDGYNAASGEVQRPFLRWVIYSPWATPESTGISARRSLPGTPWIMFPGTPGAHIMITPPQPGGGN